MLEAEDLGSPIGGAWRRTCFASSWAALRERRRRCSRPSWCSLEPDVWLLGPKEGLVNCNCGGTSLLSPWEDAIDTQEKQVRHCPADVEQWHQMTQSHVTGNNEDEASCPDHKFSLWELLFQYSIRLSFAFCRQLKLKRRRY